MEEKKILRLSLKKKWFDLIQSGVKTEEYREIKPYWYHRLHNKHFDCVEFTLGYPKKDDMSRRMMFNVKGIFIGEGVSELGAPDGVNVYVIALGERIEC